MSESCANPLLLGWIKEWLDQARERNSKGVTVYKKAYESMKACPLIFQHPSEAQQLNGLGPKLCDRLTEKLKAYCEENGLPMPEPPHRSAATNGKRLSEDGLPGSQPAKRTRKPKAYVPALRSGPYALILGLATQGEDSSQGMTKQQLIEVAQPFCDASFTVPAETGKFYTAWNSMKTLVQKELVYEHGRPLRKYALTEEGWEVAKVIRKTLSGNTQATLSFGISMSTASVSETVREPNNAGSGILSSLNALPRQAISTTLDCQGGSDRPRRDRPEVMHLDEDEHQTSATAYRGPSGIDQSAMTPIPLPPNSFTIQLVLDTREVRSSKDRDYISSELMKKGITPEVRALELGDAMWVAKCKDPTFLSRYGEEGDEVMLDWIVERKRLDDLIGSIKDGRFHEQKFRLRRSGIKHVIYLIEEFQVAQLDAASGWSSAKYHEMVTSAIASTQVVNGYFVKKTKNLDDTIRYLARMTYLLRQKYEAISSSSGPASSITFIPSHQVSSSQSYLSALGKLRADNPTVTYGATFSTFSALTSKSDVLSLRDVFLKMLMCTRGVTGERALELQRRWRTPRELVEAFEAFDKQDPQEKEDMVYDGTKHLIGRKKIVKAVSKKIADVWGTTGSG